MQQNGADGRDAVLQPHGQPHEQQPHGIELARLEIVAAQPQNREFFCHIDQTQQTRDELTDERRPARARHAHFERHNKEQVERNIQQAREDQKQQRCAAVAEGAENAGERVIEHRGRDAEEDQKNIVISIGKRVLGRVHRGQDPAAAERREQGHDEGDQAAQPDHVADEAAQTVLVAFAEFLRHGDGKARADARAEADDQEADRAGRADAGKRLDAERFADDNGVDHGIELLKQQPQQQGQNERQQDRQRAADSHIAFLGHMKTPRFLKKSKFRFRLSAQY